MLSFKNIKRRKTGVARKSGTFVRTGSLKIDEDSGELKGWDTIMNQISNSEKDKAVKIKQDMTANTKQPYWKVSLEQPDV